MDFLVLVRNKEPYKNPFRLTATKIDQDDDGERSDDLEEEEERRKKKRKKMTKSELYKAYAGKSPTAMFLEFMLDTDLRTHAILITEIASPLEDKYASDLRAQDGGLESFIQWNVARAQGAWWETAKQIFAVAYSFRLMEKLGLTNFCKPALKFDPSVSWMVVPLTKLDFGPVPMTGAVLLTTPPEN